LPSFSGKDARAEFVLQNYKEKPFAYACCFCTSLVAIGEEIEWICIVALRYMV
jgi:hypothetical protein